jgi:predicted XRE-type DNA-binding protein
MASVIGVWITNSSDFHRGITAFLDLPGSDREMLKAQLTVQIYRVIEEHGLTPAEAAELLGTAQSQIFALMRRRPVSISVARLTEFLTLLGQDVEITIKPAAPKHKRHMSLVVETA